MLKLWKLLREAIQHPQSAQIWETNPFFFFWGSKISYSSNWSLSSVISCRIRLWISNQCPPCNNLWITWWEGHIRSRGQLKNVKAWAHSGQLGTANMMVPPSVTAADGESAPGRTLRAPGQGHRTAKNRKTEWLVRQRLLRCHRLVRCWEEQRLHAWEDV